MTSFFTRILLPSLTVILLFLVAMYLFVIPGYRENLLDKKRETIRELTNTAWSVLHRLNNAASDTMDLEQVKNEAASVIRGMRYGEEGKDYFWITDTIPVMIMHPYRHQMEGMELTQYTDPEGKKFFVEITQIVQQTGDGYIDYKWQWKDDSLMVVPKLSYVKLYEPWGWIIGTGIYVEDVQREIATITQQVVWTSILITLLIAAVFAYLARRNFSAERQRQKAQEKQKETMEKYKKLVEASSEGVLMTMDGEIVYCNPFLTDLMGFDPRETDEKDPRLISSLNCFLQIRNQKNISEQENPEIIKEQKVKKKDGSVADVIITRSRFEIEGKNGFIYTVKDVSVHKDVQRELDLSMEKFKSIADMMNLGIFRCTMGRQSRFIEINNKAIKKLGFQHMDEMKDMQVQDLFHEREEKKEILRALSESLVIKDRLVHIRRSDGTILPVMVSLFPVKDIHEKSVYCDGILIDAYEHISREAGYEKNSPQLSASILLKHVRDYIQEAPVCDTQTPVEVASRIMTMEKADLILVQNDKKEVMGLMTHRDISRRTVARGLNPQMPVSQIMSAPVIAVSDQDMIMDAFSLMMEHQISYVVVKRMNKETPGYLSLLALSELRRNTPEFLTNSIHKAQSVEEVSLLMKQVPRLIHNLVETGTGADTAGKLISRISDTVTEKFVKKAIDELGEPPVPFIFLALGSEGRKEQSLATDQDNAIVYNTLESNDKDKTKSYFLEMGKFICQRLDKVGYPYCEGGVMAMNPEWCLDMNEIKKRVKEWISTPNPQELLSTAIFFDFRPAYGDLNLASDLQLFSLAEAKDKNVFFYNLARNIVSLKPKAAFLGKSVFSIQEKKEDYFNVKEPLMIITAIIRLWALKFGISEKNTLERLLALRSYKLMPDSFTEDFGQAFRHLTHLRIQGQLRSIDAGEKPNNLINPRRLSDMDRIMIKRILSSISDHQARLVSEFRLV